MIQNSLQVTTQLVNDVDMRLYMHDVFGKGLMKKCKTSPDAFIQMALQLAYYRVSCMEVLFTNSLCCTVNLDCFVMIEDT